MNKLAAYRAGFAQGYFEKRAADDPTIDAKSRRWLKHITDSAPIAALKDISNPDTKTGRVPGYGKMYKWLNEHISDTKNPLEKYRRFAAANSAAAALNAVSGKPAGELSIGDFKDVPGLLERLQGFNWFQVPTKDFNRPDRVGQAKSAWYEYWRAADEGLLPPKLHNTRDPRDKIFEYPEGPLNTIRTYNALRNDLGLDYTTALGKIPPKDRYLVNALIQSGVISPAVQQ